MVKDTFGLLSGTVEFSNFIDAKQKTNLSILHMHSALILNRESAKYEKLKSNKYLPNNKDKFDYLMKKHRACVTGAITLAIAFVESNINELFLEAVEGNKILFNELPPNFQDILSQLWDRVNRFSILDKYQLTLAVASKEKFNKGESVYQNISYSIRLRNALVHYKPEWDNDLKEHKRLEDCLKSKFKLNPFVNVETTFFPHRCLSHGCAEWVLQSCINFIDSFNSKMGLPQNRGE